MYKTEKSPKKTPIIAFDLGNTHLRYGIVYPSNDDPIEVVHLGWGECESAVISLFDTFGKEVAISVASVVASSLNRLETLLETVGHEGSFVICRVDESQLLVNNYAPTLGIDRYVDAAAAAELYPGRDCIVIDSGTATTVDFIRHDRTFLGGFILPGIGLKARAIGEKTDKLPVLDPYSLAVVVPPVTTVDAVAGGLLLDSAGGIERAIREGESLLIDPVIVACGGGWEIIGPYVQRPVVTVPDLTLRGTALVGVEQIEKRRKR